MDTVEGLVSVVSQSYPGPRRKTSGLTSKLCLMVGINWFGLIVIGTLFVVEYTVGIIALQVWFRDGGVVL